MLEAIRNARESIILETYIFAFDQIGGQMLQALVEAAIRGVKVQVLADDYGSITLPNEYFDPLTTVGGEVRFFNPIRFGRFGVRDHRKLLVCDKQTVFVGGANIADEYDGDGLTQGWFDLMLRLEGTELGRELTDAFNRIFNSAERRLLPRLRAFRLVHPLRSKSARVLVVRPGRGSGLFQRSLQKDLSRARSADFIVPYFLPGRRLRKRLRQIARRDGQVRLILPAKCDVPVARAASMFYYPKLLKAGVQIYEYQPQILHAKLYRVDDVVYAGSSNLDLRSFKLNYELMLRLTDTDIVGGAREIFTEALRHSVPVELKAFRQTQNFWERLKCNWAHFLLARVDPLIALRQME